MEQIAFLIIVGLYYLLTSARRKANHKQRQLKPGTPAPRTRRPPRPGTAQDVDVENLPDFLRQMLGIEEPPQAPSRPVSPQRDPRRLDPMAEPSSYDLPPVTVPHPGADTELLEKPGSDVESDPNVNIYEGTYEAPTSQPLELPPLKTSLPKTMLGLNVPATKRRKQHPISKLLKNRDSLKQAFLLREILDTPVSKRPPRDPFSGMF